MSKKTYLVLITLGFIFLSLSTAFADLPVPRESSKGSLNMDILEEKGWAVYGTPADVKESDIPSLMPSQKYDAGTEQWRYIGYDCDGNIFSNPNFPNDADSGREPWEKNWLKEPWEEGYCNPPRIYAQGVKMLDELDWGHHIHTKTGEQLTGENLIHYFVILSPQTNYTQGVFRGWHKIN